MGAIAGVVSSALSASGKSGQKGDIQQNNVSQTAPVSNNSNNGNNLPDIKEAKVENAAEPVGETKTVEAPKAEGGGAGKMDWGKLANLAGGLTAPQGSSAPITANNVSNTQPVANFR